MKGVVSSLVVKPFLHSSFGGVAGAAVAATAGQLLFSPPILPLLASAALSGVICSTYGGARASVSGMRKILIGNRVILKAIPNFLLEKESLSVEDAAKISEGMTIFLDQPPFLPKIIGVRWVWHFAIDQIISVDVLRSLPGLLLEEANKAKQRGDTGLTTRVIAETVVIGKLDQAFGNFVSSLDKKFFVVWFVLAMVPYSLDIYKMTTNKT